MIAESEGATRVPVIATHACIWQTRSAPNCRNGTSRKHGELRRSRCCILTDQLSQPFRHAANRPLAGAAGLFSVAIVYRLAPHMLTALIVTIAGLPMIIMPLHPDQATFAMVGRAIAGGRFPYVDVWDQKPPALFVIFAIAVQGPFDVMRNVRVFDILWTAATAVVLLELGRRWWSLRAGVLTGLIYGLVHVNNNPWWQSGQPDSLMVLPLALALLLYERARGRRGLLITSGVLLGIVCQLRFPMALYIPFIPLVELVEARRDRPRLWIHRMVWLGVGFVALQTLLMLYLAAGDALGEFLRTMRYASRYSTLGGPWNPEGGPTIHAYLTTLRDSFVFWAYDRLVLVLPAVVGGFCGALLLRNARVGQLLIFLVLSYVVIAIQAKFFWYHYGHMFLSLALLSGWTWDQMLGMLRRAWSAPVAYGIAVSTAVVLVLNSAQVRTDGPNQWRNLVRFSRQPETRELYYALAGHGFDNVRRAGFYVRERSQPHDSIFVWGFEPAIYLVADRPPGARFMFTFPFMSDWSPPEWRTSFVEELDRRRPIYFIVEYGLTATWITGESVEMSAAIESFPALKQWLAANYDFEADIAGVTLYRRRD